MKYRVFEEVAAEARAEIQELDAEIDRLKAKRELLQVAEALVRQVLAAIPMNTEAIPADEAHDPDMVPSAAVTQPPGREESLQGRRSASPQEEEQQGSHPHHAAGPTPDPTPCSSPDVLPDHCVVFLQTEEVPSESSAGAVEEITLPEHPPYEDALSEDDSEALTIEDSPANPPADSPPVPSDAARPSFADLLARKEPFSLRKQGWPEPSPMDEGEIRKKLL